jgi:hypothetical protein
VLQRWEVTRLSLTRLVTAQRILAGDALRCSFSCFLSSCDIGGDPEANTPPPSDAACLDAPREAFPGLVDAWRLRTSHEAAVS